MACVGADIAKDIDLNKVVFEQKVVALYGSNCGTFRSWFKRYSINTDFPGNFPKEMKRMFAPSPVEFVTENGSMVSVKPVGVNFDGTHCLRPEEIEIAQLLKFWSVIQNLITSKEILRKYRGIVKLHPAFQYRAIKDWLANIKRIAQKTPVAFIEFFYGGDVNKAICDLEERFCDLLKIKQNSKGNEVYPEVEENIRKYFKGTELFSTDALVSVSDAFYNDFVEMLRQHFSANNSAKSNQKDVGHEYKSYKI
jgi:hypothetical protein